MIPFVLGKIVALGRGPSGQLLQRHILSNAIILYMALQSTDIEEGIPEHGLVHFGPYVRNECGR